MVKVADPVAFVRYITQLHALQGNHATTCGGDHHHHCSED